MTRVKGIVTHERPHIDEICALWLLKRFGGEKFPGVAEAPVSFWATGGEAPDGLKAEMYEEQGFLLIGVGGGRFDEHPRPGQPAKKNECATTLVAKELGVDDDPALERIVKFVINADLRGAGNPFDLSCLVKTLYHIYPDRPAEVMNWAMIALDAKHKEQMEFLTATREEFQKSAQIEEVQGPNNRTIKVATVVSDNEQMNRFARSKHGGCMAGIIQQQASGNVQIYTNRQFGITLYDVSQMIRLEEQQLKDKVVTTDWEALAGEGKVLGVEEWYFHYGLQALLNGSLTAKGVPPTRIPLARIQEIVRVGINPAAFEPARANTCSQGNCTSSKASPCPWYPWGLHRCRKIRFQSAR